jgi:large subunit ribosomal protein L10
MLKARKPEVVAELNSLFNDNSFVVIAHQTGLTVQQSGDLRVKMRGANATFRVAKNTLARLAAKGTPCEVLDSVLKGPTTIAAANDPVAVAKVAAEFAKANDKFTIVAGVMDGKLLSAAEVQVLATLPSLDQLRGKIIGIVLAPATKIAGIVQAPAAQLARVVGAFANKS